MHEFVPFLAQPEDDASSQAEDAPSFQRLPARPLDPPRYPARIAVYDDMIAPPRVVVIEPVDDIAAYLTQIIQTVHQLMNEQGGELPYTMIRELVENFIHASFIEPTISILDKGQTLVFSDQGPGIANKSAAMKPSFSTATREMKRYIRGVGSGLPMVESYLKMRNGSLTIEDNLDHGTIVTVTFAHHEEEDDPLNDTPHSYLISDADRVMQQHSQQVPQNPQLGYQQPSYQQYYPSMYQQGMYPHQTAYPAYPQAYPYQGAGAAYPYPVQPSGIMNQTYPAQPWNAALQGQQRTGAAAAQAVPQTPQNIVAGLQGQYVHSLETPTQQSIGYAETQASTSDSALQPSIQLTPKQKQVLGAFRESQEVGGKDLAAQLGVSAPTVSRRLKELEALGLVMKSGQKYELTQQGARELANLIDKGM